MPRLAIAVLLSLGPLSSAFGQIAPPAAKPPKDAVATAAAVPFPSEAETRAFVRSYVDQYCTAQSDHCAESRELLKGYEDALGRIEACRAEPCAFDNMLLISRQLKALDLKAAALPFYPRYGHPLLRLSVLASARLGAEVGALEARDGKKRFLETTDEFSPAGVAKAVEQECLESPETCALVRPIYNEAMKVFPEVNACADAACSFQATEALVLRAGACMARYFEIKAKTLPLFSFLDHQRSSALQQLSAQVDGRLLALSAGADKLSARLDRMEKNAPEDPKDLRRDSDALFNAYREASVGEDRISFYLGYEKSAKRPAVNAAAGRLAGLRARALAVMAARGLALPAADAAAVKPGLAAKDAAHGTAQAVPTLLDSRAVPNPAGAGVPKADAAAPAIMDGGWFPPELMRRMISGDPVEVADAKRRLGMTRTIGSPGLYAAQAYRQRFANTCAIATQVQVLRAHGFLPLDVDPAVQEAELGKQAGARDFFDDGTPPNFAGEMLIERGFIVTKNHKAEWPDVEAALKRGHIAQLSVDGRYLWPGRDPAVPLPHAILATGLEVDKVSGEVLGVYINDTGTTPPGGGRFVPVAKMRSAMLGELAEIE